MEAIAAAMGHNPRWFQLYWGKSDDLVASLVRRAEACGAEAIVVTLDTALLGWRTRDLDLGYLPFLQAKGIAQYTSDPVFRAMLGDKAGDPLAEAMLFMGIYSNPTITWDRIGFLRGVTKLPIILKGINHPADARQAIRIGVDGIVVSNHGGRQVDGAVAALDALELVARETGGAMPVLFDSGIRSGADIFKAIALGADRRPDRPPLRLRAWRWTAKPASPPCCATCSPSWISPWACPAAAPSRTFARLRSRVNQQERPGLCPGPAGAVGPRPRFQAVRLDPVTTR